MNSVPCRFCGQRLSHVFADLGVSPLANSYVAPENLLAAEPFYPLCSYVCESCFLVQLPEFESPDSIFRDYAYFSSYSDSWLEHARLYTEEMIERLSLSESSQVVEIASNDGYLLKNFRKQSIPVLGIEPAENVAQAARDLGIETLTEFFGTDLASSLAEQGVQADLLLGNNVLAHVPALNDFVGGLKILLADDGVVTMEFPHLMRLIEQNQFDTIYHEHFSYFSFTTAQRVFAAHGLKIFDVQELTTHGGSLRIFAAHEEDAGKPPSAAVPDLARREAAAGILSLDSYTAFGLKTQETKRRLLSFLIDLKRERKTIVGYGAPAKGNTLLNFCGIGNDFLDYTVDRSPHKQGRYLPGSRLPIDAPEKIFTTRPDYVFILPWNLREEILEDMRGVRDWGGRFFVAIPDVTIL